ncbi:serine protease [Cytobacillus sp. FSL M8-0252]|uniref:trypsin-like serine peptidase n=1 Tax=Cytobacillus sp. FSL M8-0252 TaxID=2921621 RepID=UPI0030F530D5
MSVIKKATGVLLLLLVFYSGQVFADESASTEKTDSNTPVSFDGETEKIEEHISSKRSESSESVSPSYQGTGEVLTDEEKIDIPEEIKDLIDKENESINSPFIEPFSIIGADNRTKISNTTSYPNRAIVKINALFPNDLTTVYGCTGFMVSPDTVVTAGHCIYSHDDGGWAEIVNVAPGRNGNSYPYGTHTMETLYSVTGWTRDENASYDYGAIKLSSNVGNNTGWLGFRSYTSVVGLNASVTGYPCDKPTGTMWTHAGPIEFQQSYQIRYNMDTYGCQSGSPVYRNYTDTGQTAVGIHAYGTSPSANMNKGTRITQAVFDNINDWKDR